jgi:hypothetical protein
VTPAFGFAILKIEQPATPAPRTPQSIPGEWLTVRGGRPASRHGVGRVVIEVGERQTGKYGKPSGIGSNQTRPRQYLRNGRQRGIRRVLDHEDGQQQNQQPVGANPSTAIVESRAAAVCRSNG